MGVVSNEEIIAALLLHGTVKEAAGAVGMAPRTLYDRMNGKEFRAQYMEAKAGIMRQAATTMGAQLSTATATIVDIMQDKGNNAAVRLQAAQTL